MRERDEQPTPGPPARRAATAGERLRGELRAREPCQIMGAHDGLSARIAAHAGFGALWASGLCMSAALGVRDCDEASWTEILGVVATMVDATDVPVLVDGDTGYGNFNTARRFAARAERLGAAGVCFEDKRFPKMNSFFGDSHDLAPLAQVRGTISACKDGQAQPSFVLVARTEALIAGRSVGEALERAAAYVEAGADALFVHSRRSTPVEVESFMRQWDGSRPVLVAPTTYASTPMAHFRRMGVAGVIWANHSMRAAFAAMRAVCEEVRAAGSTAGVDGRVAPLDEVFELLDYGELLDAELRYAAAPDPALDRSAVRS